MKECVIEGIKYDVFEVSDFDKIQDRLAAEFKSGRCSLKYKREKTENGYKRHYYLNFEFSFDIENSSGYRVNIFKKGSVFFTNSQVEKILAKIFETEYEKALKRYKYRNESNKEKKAYISALAKTTKASMEYENIAFMYHWQMAFGTDFDTNQNGFVVVGTTWDEWVSLLISLKKFLKLHQYCSLICYVHNLNFEINWIKKYFEFDLETPYACLYDRNTTYKMTTKGIKYKDDDGNECVDEFYGFIFKDSLVLSGVKEANLPKIMTTYSNKCHKLVGNLDYNKVRLPNGVTPLTNDELAYCFNDVALVNWFIREKIEQYDGNITKIPLTKTGEVRIECRDRLFYTNQNIKSKKDDKYIRYHAFLQRMKLDYETYLMVRRAYAGGFTHCNKKHALKTIINKVMSMDIASSFPSQIVMCDRFPMSPYEDVIVESTEQFNEYIDNYACLFDITFYNIRPRKTDKLNYDNIDSIISVSKAEQFGIAHPKYKPIFYDDLPDSCCTNNGRIRKAKRISLTINEIDWWCISMFYEWDSVEVGVFKIATPGYLPKDIILYTLELFRNKTKYKPFDGTNTPEGILYKLSKERINSLYGMISFNPCRNNFQYDGDGNVVDMEDWLVEDIEDEDEKEKTIAEYRINKLEQYMNDEQTFLPYQWSMVITSAAKYSLLRCIADGYGEDYCYSDTDSGKGFKSQHVLDWMKEYNEEVDERMNACFEFYGLPKDSHKASYEKKMKDGSTKTVWKCLGHFELENGGDVYRRFVCCRAKSYLTETKQPDDEGRYLHLTVAGLAKNTVDYLEKKYGRRELFKAFEKSKVVVDAEHTNKSTLTHCNQHIEGYARDYLGNIGYYEEESYIHFKKCEFNMNLCNDFEKMISSGIMGGGI